VVILLNELLTSYEALASGVDSRPAPADSFSYRDYVIRQQEMLADGRGERLWDYWRGQLENDIPALKLPTDRPRTKDSHRRGRFHVFAINPDITRQLREFSSTHSSTLYTTLLAAFQVLLSRYTGQPEFLVGTPTHGRERAELADAVGYFINPLPMRADLTGDPTFESYHAALTARVLESFAHGAMPLVLLAERLLKVRDSGAMPSFFDVLFTFQKAYVKDFH
jgi:hypothetical protein